MAKIVKKMLIKIQKGIRDNFYIEEKVVHVCQQDYKDRRNKFMYYSWDVKGSRLWHKKPIKKSQFRELKESALEIIALK